MRNVRTNVTVKSAAAALLSILLFGACALAASSPLLPYRRSGNIPGTALLYDGLAIGNNGRVAIVISNPGRTGESFVANFSFHTEKGAYLTGFSIDGFAGRMSRTSYALDLPNHRSVRKAAYMRVLGRSGRLSE